MGEKSNIGWTDSTVNFWSGCTKVSAGCKNCYAETLSNRNLGNIGKWGKGAPRELHESAFTLARRLNKKPWICPVCSHGMTEEESKGYRGCPVEMFDQDASGKRVSFKPKKFKIEMHAAQHHRRRIFSLSLGDWLDAEVPIEWLVRMLDTIRLCADVTWILCTKRPERWVFRLAAARKSINGSSALYAWLLAWSAGTPPPNVILLTSVEDQPSADARVPELLKIPAARRGLSLEPLLGAVSVSQWLYRKETAIEFPDHAKQRLHWLIAGGESGPGARGCDVSWIESLVKQGKAAGVATFVKQLGARPYQTPEIENGTGYFLSLKDKKGGDPAEWPADLRVQQWPKGF